MVAAWRSYCNFTSPTPMAGSRSSAAIRHGGPPAAPYKCQTILDFGQNMVGWVHMRVRGPQDTTITLRHAEMLDQQGNLYTENLRSADQITRYTLRGLTDTDELFEPHFTFQGFQY